MTYSDYVEENRLALESVDLTALTRMERGLVDARKRDSQVFFFGNGGSAASASHAVGDIVKTAKGERDSGGVRAISVSEMQALFTAYSNDTSFEAAGSGVLHDMGRPGDILVLISVSGRSPNLLAAARTASELGIEVWSLVGAGGDELAKLSDVAIKISSNDYQVVENAHMSLIHYLTKILQRAPIT